MTDITWDDQTIACLLILIGIFMHPAYRLGRILCMGAYYLIVDPYKDAFPDEVEVSLLTMAEYKKRQDLRDKIKEEQCSDFCYL